MSKIITTAALVTIAEEFFNNYKQCDEVFITEDGQPFFEENRALLHAEDKKLTCKKFTRGFVEVADSGADKKTIPPTANSPEYRGANPAEEKAKYEAKVAELMALEFASKNYQQMKALVQYFNLETADMKAPTLIEALEAFKQKLS
ncbi:hypothetical protein D1Z98_06310 [Riemerella anatipestifer]|uniref:hypothetical protein n=1 Tax=Riemerella anatipestifer TaxID=34085 RepID=UPI00129DBF2A|nr:hypothetical protein [Riemerella anatipestifer]MRM94597.1 hypothetical protein [Riemerella anatipestifer]